MAEILGAELQADRFISADPGNGVLAALDALGAAVNLVAWDDATGDVTHSAPAGDGANTRRHLFDRPIVSTSTAQFTTVTAALVGNVTGNASTATALQTARTIFGQSFDGTGNVSGGITATTGSFSGAVALGATLSVAGILSSNGPLELGSSWSRYRNQISGISTTVTTIFASSQVGGLESGNYSIVFGTTGGGTQFVDVVLWMTNGTHSVFGSATQGSPASRTYSVSGSSLRLQMGGGTYFVTVLNDKQGYA